MPTTLAEVTYPFGMYQMTPLPEFCVQDGILWVCECPPEEKHEREPYTLHNPESDANLQ